MGGVVEPFNFMGAPISTATIAGNTTLVRMGETTTMPRAAGVLALNFSTVRIY